MEGGGERQKSRLFVSAAAVPSASVGWANSWLRYIDEVQDNLLIDTLGLSPAHHSAAWLTYIFTTVLRTLCSNPLGLFWAGDTAQVSIVHLRIAPSLNYAQTISIGSSFKFSDLKAFQYRIEVSGFSNVPFRAFSHPIRKNSITEETQPIRRPMS